MKYKLLRQIVMISKLSFYGILLQCVLLQVLWATDVKAQKINSVREVHINVNFGNANIQDVFAFIESKTDFYFSYNVEDIRKDVRITKRERNISVASLLEEISREANLKFKQVNKNINVNLIKDTDNRDNVIEIVIQTRNVTGRVTSQEDGLGLPGVNVIEKGTSNGTVTNVEGMYSLSVAEGATLVFSSVGYTRTEIEIGNRSVIDLMMVPDIQQLEELVVVGYGTQKRISVTGAIVSVENDELIKNPSASISHSLAGRVTGLTSVQFSGRPGADDASIYIRGVGSLSEARSRPLVLVDGVERSFSQLDPNEVESISILKDASATAVYGIRGANGVIIVTTKRGSEGAPRIRMTTSFGLQQPTKIVEMANSYNYAIKHNEATLNDNPNAFVKFSPEAVEAFRTGSHPQVYPNSNWASMLIKPFAPQDQQNINISGGSKIVKYFVSMGRLSQDGLFRTFNNPDSYTWGYKRYNYRTNIDVNMTETTRLSLSIGGQNRNVQRPGSMPVEGDFTVLYWAVPYSGLIHEGKRILTDVTYIPGTEATHKDGLTAIGWGTGFQRQLNNTMNVDLGLNQKLDFVARGLSWRFKLANNSNIGHTKTRTTTHPYYTAFFRSTLDPTAPGDSSIVYRMGGSKGLLGYGESSSKARNWYMETALYYDRDFKEHHITGLLLYNQSQRFYPGSPYNDIPTGYVGMAARTTYSFKERYMLDLNLGYNGSENFAPGMRFGFFPAASVAWVLSEEGFMKDKLSFVNLMKFRASYGTVGNDQIGGSRFLYMADSWNNDTGVFGYNFGTISDVLQKMAREGRIGNPNVTWEKAEKQNYGIDLRFFNSRMMLSADRFYEYRDNILTTMQTVPGIISMSLPALNIGKVENKGYELELRWKDKIGKANYYLNTTMSYARNKILFMDEIPPAEPYLSQTGLRVGERFGYVFEGFWTEEEAANHEAYPNHFYIPKAGDVRYKDVNEDGVINAHDQLPIGFPDRPEYIFSLSNGIEYKGFDISMLWTAVTNVSRVLNDTWRTPFSSLQDRGLTQWHVDNAWTPETASTALAPRMTFFGLSNNTRVSALWLRDASYIRLKNIEIGYSFSPNSLKNLGISRLRLSTNGYDLLTFSKMIIIDPEQSGDYNHPLVKIYNLNLNVTF
jgi:TonB-linked SusC/RagA family outer membrane protein